MAQLTISLRRKLVRVHTSRRRKNAVGYLRSEVAKHAKVDKSTVAIGMDVNEYLIRNVGLNMRPVQLNVDKTKDGVLVALGDSLKNWNKKAKAAEPAPVPGKKEEKKPAPDAKQKAPAPKALPQPQQKQGEQKKTKPDEKKQV